MLGDEAFNTKPVPNTIASKGYISMEGITSSRGIGAKIRDRIYYETLYEYRSVGESIPWSHWQIISLRTLALAIDYHKCAIFPIFAIYSIVLL